MSSTDVWQYDPHLVQMERARSRFTKRVNQHLRWRWLKYTIALVVSAILVVGTSLIVMLVGPLYQDSQVRVFEVNETLITTSDNVLLFTKIFTPVKREGEQKFPILLIRTPYGTPAHDPLTGLPSCNDTLAGLHQDGDIKGRFNSSGAFSVSRHDHEAQHAYDTIDWLVLNVPNNNNRVGMLGTSYDAMLTLLALKKRHPALLAVAPFAAPVDFWLFDDIGHNGAFRYAPTFDYVTTMETNTQFAPWQHKRTDLYASYLEDLPTLISADAALASQLRPLPTWTKVMNEPNYSQFWRDLSLIPMLKELQLDIPMLLATGWFDAEDFTGGIAPFEYLRNSSATIHLVVGPWRHGQWFSITAPADPGRFLGPLDFLENTAEHFRFSILPEFFKKALIEAEPITPKIQTTMYQTGANKWQFSSEWPPSFNVTPVTFYFATGNQLLPAPEASTDGKRCFISDPAIPVPYKSRPIKNWWSDADSSFAWMVADQREFQYRPDIIFWQTGPLENELELVGSIKLSFFASTTGTDADWIIKVVDAYPENDLRLPGYQMLLVYDTFRAKYFMNPAGVNGDEFSNFASPAAVPANQIVQYSFSLPKRNHLFAPGHRIMVTVQSTMFPLIDRNPQQFLDITQARPSDFIVAEHCVHFSVSSTTTITLPHFTD